MNDTMKVKSGNIYSHMTQAVNDEIFDTILSSDRCEIQRIISKGHKSPSGYWYDQERDEWVILLRGAATLKFNNGNKIIEMMPGDYIHIPAHCKHRVESTDPDIETIWLAVHF